MDTSRDSDKGSDKTSDKGASPHHTKSIDNGASPRHAKAKPLSSKTRVFDVNEEAPLLETAKWAAHKARTAYLPTREETHGFTWLDWAGYFLPCIVWLRTYQLSWLFTDVIAGLSVGAMVIPQGMSYANLAGLPSVFGLYGAFIPPLIYSLFGSSRQLAVGPVAVTSMLLGTGLSNMLGFSIENPSSPANATEAAEQEIYNHAAVQIAFLAGIMYTGIGLLRLGWVTNFLSHSTISGFMSGACITIALSQVKYILGLSIGRVNVLASGLNMIFSAISQFKWREFVMGMAFIFVLLLFKFLGGRFRRLSLLKALGPLTVCILSIALMNIFEWYNAPAKIKTVGVIPKGMPPFTASWFFPLQDVGRQIVLAVLVCLIDVCESISIARAMAQKNHYQLRPTQELRALGFSNIAGSLFSCYTTTGSFSRSAVNNSIGAKTLLSSFCTGLLLMLTLLVLTPVFKNMSANVQGSIIIVGVLQLFDYNEFIYLWKVNKFDWLVWNVVFFFVLFLGVEIGIGVGVGVSLFIVVYKSAFPRISLLGKLPNTDIYRSIKMYPDTESTPGVLVLRIDAPIWFANVENIKAYILAKLDKHLENPGTDRIRFLILDLAPASDVDATAVHFFVDFLRIMKDRNIQLALANPSREVLAALKRGDLVRQIGADHVHVNVHDAVLFAKEEINKEIKQEAVDAV